MATSFNLQEYILFRTEIKRELTNAEVDTNFKMVANPWEADRVYEIGNIVYHPVIVDDPSTTGMDQVLAWWRANTRTTQGVFNTAQWDMIGGIGSGNINIQGANSFGRITVNSTAPTGALQTGNDATVTSTTPNDIFNLIAGQGMQLQYNLASKSIVLVNTLASNPGEINAGINVGTGTGHQDVYAGKTGLNLEFRGFQATNTGAGAALSISTNTTQKNIEYNFNEGLVDLAQLNSGAPTIGMLSNVSSAAPNAQDILQYNIGSGTWIPVALSSLGQVNIYGNDGNIGAAIREVKLNGTAGQLQFNRISDLTTGIHFDNTSNKHQLQLRNSSATGVAAQTYALNSVVKSISGVFGADGSFGVAHAAALSGLTVDALSISLNNELYVPNVATSSLPATAVGYRIPLVNAAASGTTGRFESTGRYTLTSYTNQGGTLDASVRLRGKHILTGISEQNTVVAISSDIDSQHDFVGNTSLTDGYGLRMTYKTPTATEGVNIYQWMDRGAEIYYAQQLQTDSATGAFASKYIGTNISLDNKVGGSVALNVGQIIGFTGTGTNPQRVGLYSNVVDTQTDATSEAILSGLVTDSGTWAGYFVGCVNIDKGGLVLPSTSFAGRPLCNDVSGGTTSDRTLWINSANGHLYRGTVDIEAGGGGGGSSTLGGLSDVTITDVQNDQLLVYNTATGQWENAALAAYNLNAVSLTTGGVSIALSDGAASSDVDLIPGTNIGISVNEATDEITLSASYPASLDYNIANRDLFITEPRTLDFYDPGNDLNNPLTFINTQSGSTKNLFKFEQTGAGTVPQFTVGDNANWEGTIVVTGNGSNRAGMVKFNEPSGTYSTTMRGATGMTADIIYNLPSIMGTQNQVLELQAVSGTQGTLGWRTVTGGGGGVGATGATGYTGATGATGYTGATGSTGATGAIGPRNGLPWQSTSSTTTPASGKFYYDASTTSLYINKTDSLGLDQTTFLNTFDDTGQSSTGFGAVILTAGNNNQILHGIVTAVSLGGNVYDLTITELTNTANWGSGIDFTLEFTAYGTSITGATGATGAGGVGSTGATGFQGATGVVGFQGATGFTGSTGAVGQQGATGEQGSIGLQGATGTQGKQGPDGDQGATGSQGATGVVGQQGATGQQGAKGETGDKGATGFGGATGSQGATGVGGTGAQGGTGAIGNQGAVGPQGGGGAASVLWSEPTIIKTGTNQTIPANSSGSSVDTALYGTEYIDQSTLSNGLQHADFSSVGTGKTDGIKNTAAVSINVQVRYSVLITTSAALSGGSARLQIINHSGTVLHDEAIEFVGGGGQGRFYTGIVFMNLKNAEGVGMEVRNPTGNPDIVVEEFTLQARKMIASFNIPT